MLMITRIPVEVSGDCWNNPAYVKNALETAPENSSIRLELRSEGPSLTALGIRSLVDNWAISKGRNLEDIQIYQWHNIVEPVPYTKILCHTRSHFFEMSRNYWVDDLASIAVGRNSRRFGLFIGRSTFARSAILYQCSSEFTHYFFVSKMVENNFNIWNLDYSTVVNLEKPNEWFTTKEIENIENWIRNSMPPSVDSMSVGDQYTTPNSYAGIHQSLLGYYNKFDIELACESYTIGNTFFPTEKSIRPIMAAKPFIVYGPKHFLARLRSMNFKTYHELWDESYDLLEGPARWHEMKKIVKSICELDKFSYDSLLAKTKEIALHNRTVLASVSREWFM